MKLSRNPVSGVIESYSDDCIFAGPVLTMMDLIGQKTANDGGPGSGNFGHAGRPGKVGGSAGRSGIAERFAPEPGSAPEERPVKPVKEQKSGVDLANKKKEEFDSAPNNGTLDFKKGIRVTGKREYVGEIFGYKIVKMVNQRTPEEEKELYYKYLEVLKKNGDPEKTSKKKEYVIQKFADTDSIIERCGFKGEDAKRIEETLFEYTGDDWKEASQEDLEEFIKKSPVVFCGHLARGIHASKEDVEKILKEAETGTLQFDRVTSWSGKSFTASAFATRDDDNKEIPEDEIPVVFEIPSGHSRTQVQITPFSKFKSEEECIASKDTTWSVIAIEEYDFIASQITGKRRKGYRIILMERGEEYD